MTRIPEVERFMTKVDRSGDCWLWTGCLNNRGYGEFWTTGQHEYAHRASYRLFVGALPETVHVLHRCDTPRCVRPDHLFLGTAADNMSDAVAKGRQRNQNMDKTHCIRGHALAGRNLIVGNRGQRACRECSNLRRRERRAVMKTVGSPAAAVTPVSGVLRNARGDVVTGGAVKLMDVEDHYG